MFFKNAQCYRLPRNWQMTAAMLESALAQQAFVPCSSNEMMRQGFVSPRGNDLLVHTLAGQFLMKFQTEKKLLPSSVVNQVAKERADELAEAQGFYPGKKAMKELKERVADELLPRAFPIRRATFVWIDPIAGWLVIDTPTASAADDVVKALLKSIDKMPLESLRVARSPVACMTAWLETDEAPAGFTVDRDAILQSTGESRASVRYVKHTLEVADVRRHIHAGKQVTRLAMTWNDKISFTLTENLSIKGITPLDVLKESEASTRNDEERFDSDFMLMSGEMAKMLGAIVESLGGETDDLVSAAQKPAERSNLPEDGANDDELYNKAVQVVFLNRRVSISLVQRHLAIGYNRAARLIEAMEANGMVGPMMSNGDRTILMQVPT